MSAPVRLRRHLNSATLELPELAALIGKDVEIVVTEVLPEQPSDADRFPLRGSVLFYEDPDGPAVPEEEWEALR